jgi:hypothetical protein
VANILFAIETPDTCAIYFADLNHLAAVEAEDTAAIFMGGSVSATESPDTALFTIDSVSMTLEAVESQDTASISIKVGETLQLAAIEAKDTASITGHTEILVSFSVTEQLDHGSFNVLTGTLTSLQAVESKDTASISILPNLVVTVAGVENADTAGFWISQTSTTFTRRAIVMNVSTHAVTHYENFNFNSITQFNGVLIGANENGVYLLGGDDDLGKYIESELTSGLYDLSEKAVKTAIEGWVDGRFTQGGLDLKVRVDENGDPYSYPFVKFGNGREGRAKIGKGLNKHRFFAFSLKNKEGCDFDIESFRILGDVVGRKTR